MGDEFNMKHITRKTLLYKTGVEYGDYTLNHVQGCSHGCLYPCYAYMMAKRFGRVKSYEEWLQPKLVENALDLLDIEIPKFKGKIKFVNLCFTTDPFMNGFPEVQKMSIEIIKKLNENRIRVMVLTKGVYPQLLCELHNEYNISNMYGISLVSLNELFRQKYEPGASNYQERINSLYKLHAAGLKTWVSIEPYPTPNVIKQDIMEILEAVSFVDKIVYGRWNYNTKISHYNYSKHFYNCKAETVKEFCINEGISCHIKDGTITKDRRENSIL